MTLLIFQMLFSTLAVMSLVLGLVFQARPLIDGAVGLAMIGLALLVIRMLF